MSSPLAWQGDGPPQAVSASFSAHCGDQFDTSHSLASLTFIAAQLSTLLHSITLASSASASPSVTPHPTASSVPSSSSPSSTLPPLSNSLLLCHSNLVAALSQVVATSFQLLTLPTHSTPPPARVFFTPASHSVPSPSSTSPFTIPSISIPPRFTIRVVTDLEPVTPPASRPLSPSHPAPSSPTHVPHPLSPTSSTDVQSGVYSVVQNEVVVKATLYQGRAAATSPVSIAQPAVDSGDDTSTPTPPSTPTPTFTLTSTPAPTPRPCPTPPDPVADVVAVDAAVGTGENDVVEKATLHQDLVQAAAAPSHVSSSRRAADGHREADKGHGAHNISTPAATTATFITTSTTTSSTTAPMVTSRPATRSTDTPVHPFFFDLTNRTGKAAKHFRRLYPPTAAICECSLFPAFADQRQSSAPTRTLPEPFERLCLRCLRSLASRCAELCRIYCCADFYESEVQPLFWDEAWLSTFDAHYDDYYTPQQRAALEKKWGCMIDEAHSWIMSSVQGAREAAARRLNGEQGETD